MKKYIFIFILYLSLASCTSRYSGEANKPTIMVTIDPLRYFTEKIVGDQFEVISMVPQGTSPETYDPTPQQLVSFSKSNLYFRIGYIGFEMAWMDKLIANNPEMKVVDTSSGITFIREKEHKHGDHYHEGGIDPHIWNSVVNARIIAKNIFDALSETDPINTSYYRERYEKLLQEIDETGEKIDLLLKNSTERAFIIYHPALTYFARDYGLEQICIEESGKQPSPAYLKQLIRTCKEKGVRTIFVQVEFDVRNAGIIAEETHTRIVTINPLAYEWAEEMIRISSVLSGNVE